MKVATSLEVLMANICLTPLNKPKMHLVSLLLKMPNNVILTILKVLPLINILLLMMVLMCNVLTKIKDGPLLKNLQTNIASYRLIEEFSSLWEILVTPKWSRKNVKINSPLLLLTFIMLLLKEIISLNIFLKINSWVIMKKMVK